MLIFVENQFLSTKEQRVKYGKTARFRAWGVIEGSETYEATDCIHKNPPLNNRINGYLTVDRLSEMYVSYDITFHL